MGQYFLALSQDPETRPGAAEASPGGEKRRSGGGGQIQRKVSCERWDRRYCADAPLAKKRYLPLYCPEERGRSEFCNRCPLRVSGGGAIGGILQFMASTFRTINQRAFAASSW